MEPLDLLSLLNPYYIALVVVIPEFLKKYMPALGAARKNLLVLVVAFLVGLAFVGVQVEWGAGDLAPFVQQLVLSFFAATTFYGLIVKTVLSFLKK